MVTSLYYWNKGYMVMVYYYFNILPGSVCYILFNNSCDISFLNHSDLKKKKSHKIQIIKFANYTEII